MSFDYRGRTAVLTGVDNGLGAALAERLAERGATVFADYAGETAEILIEEGVGRTGRIDILVNGRLPPVSGYFPVLNPDELTAALNRYVAEPAAGMRKALLHMRGYGRIVNFVLGAGAFGTEEGAAGAAASAALAALTKCAALDAGTGDICINALSPIVNLPEMAALFDLEPALDRHLFSAEEVLPAALYLTHKSCAVSGEVYTAGGGRFSRIVASTAPGYFQPGMTVEEFAGRLHEVADPQASISPKSARGEFVLVAV